jgi:citrate lyase subunit beta/citryl-CoA lyase
MSELTDLKSWLFVPALQEKYLQRALESRAGAFIVDLEDSIPAGRKLEARALMPAMVAALRASGRPVFVRTNQGDRADLAAAAVVAPSGVVLPKAETPDEVRRAVEGLQAAGAPASMILVPAIESALGVLNATAIAGSSRQVAALMFGTGDFVADTGFAMDADALATPAALIALAARAHGLPAFGLPGSIGELNDLERLRSCALRARDLGYAGTPVIHPKQVEVIETAFSPTAADVANARRMVAAFEASEGGASALDGRLVERPVYLRAQATLRRASAAHT